MLIGEKSKMEFIITERNRGGNYKTLWEQEPRSLHHSILFTFIELIHMVTNLWKNFYEDGIKILHGELLVKKLNI